MAAPHALGGEIVPRLRAQSCLDMGFRRRPIAAICLTPAKRDQVVAGGEWLGGAGTVHDTKRALDDLSCGKRQPSCSPANWSRKPPWALKEGASRPTVLSVQRDLESSTRYAPSSLLSQTDPPSSADSLAGAIKSIRLPARKFCLSISHVVSP
ncbi:hypothetical protein IQ06DRAFT_341532 [Phaeosphaeriaceae sp. SRC1lsM3a]|nr:hypothetical protein IQ06DRAFT_341532 [Stagonospora sp. SRC1lsM3a]